MSLYLGLLALAAAVPLVILGTRRARTVPRGSDREALRYLGEEGFVHSGAVELSPTTRFFAALGRRLTPSGYLETLRERLVKSGRSRTIEAHLSAKAIGGVAGLMFGLWMLSARPVLGLVLGALATVGGFMVPDFLLTKGIDRRQEEIRKALPESLDLMAITVEAGAGLESAMARAAEDVGGPLGTEYRWVLHELQLGASRREAFQALKTRVNLPEMTNFVMAVLQADALGIAIGRVLSTQAKELRRKRRQRAREQAAKTPVKILFPLIFGIFPALLIMLLGPAAIRILGTLINR